ncbi:hypothetical protein C8R43DRAFT_1143794 [Mycena crocata]|nr:hypothetical protein C8R43DRAFT_1143794 [Mycena crocata]
MPATSSTISLVAGGSDDLDDDSRLRPVPTDAIALVAADVVLNISSETRTRRLRRRRSRPAHGAHLGSMGPPRHVAMHQQRARRPRGRTSDQTAHTFLWGSFGNPRSPFPTVELAPTRFPRPDRKCATYGYPSSRYDDRWTALTASNVARLWFPLIFSRQAEDIPALLQLRHSQIFHGAAFDGRGNYPRRASPWLKTHLLECFYWIQSPQTRTEPLEYPRFQQRVSDLTRILASNLEVLIQRRRFQCLRLFSGSDLTRPKPGLSSILARSLLDLTCSALEGRDYGQITWCILLTRHPHRTRQGTSDFESNSTSLLAGLWCTQTPNLSMERAFDLSRLSSIHSSIGLSATKGRDYLQNINGLLIGPIALSKTETIFNSNEGPLRWTYRFEGIVFSLHKPMTLVAFDYKLLNICIEVDAISHRVPQHSDYI